jgi:hypothetical protein
MSMAWIIITEFEVYKASKLTDEIKKDHSDGMIDIVRLDDGLLLSDDGKNWVSLIEYTY